jgi:nicotinate-nucleotide adenylyltransferase
MKRQSGEAMRKIAILGGTFNPIHNGHLHLAGCFAKLLGVQKVLLIPTYLPPHKSAPDLAPARHRLAMCRAAAGGIFEASDIEIRRRGPSYTSDTLRELKALYPDAELYLITGEDMFLTLTQWHEPETIFSLATVCAAPRSAAGLGRLLKYAQDLRRMGARTRVENIEYLPVSSTMVRRAVREGKSIARLVPVAVERYIREHHLYLR